MPWGIAAFGFDPCLSAGEFFRIRGMIPRRWLAGCLLGAAIASAAGCDRAAGREEAKRAGERLFREQGCVVCHGPAGRGDGPNARALNPPPRDFRDLSAYVQGTRASDVAATVQSGIRVHSAQMPSFAHLSERERLALGEFIVSLQRREERR
jgi:high-affinity iron transporter